MRVVMEVCMSLGKMRDIHHGSKCIGNECPVENWRE